MNGHLELAQPIKHDQLDSLHELMSLFHAHAGVAPGLFKADIDSAFRYALFFSSASLHCLMLFCSSWRSLLFQAYPCEACTQVGNGHRFQA